MKLTGVEYRELSYKKHTYEPVKKRSDEVEDTTEYRMLDAYDEEGGVNQENRFFCRCATLQVRSYIWCLIYLACGLDLLPQRQMMNEFEKLKQQLVECGFMSRSISHKLGL